ncbi:class I SAM-dependent methyltransferase [Synechococcus sp. Cruz-9H2]|uniref:class I SAM-dependent methyltransferase n=1 Tax=Synechococcus sp. Cruz-9H2 TaxID=2823732 RepID=UPI0020CFD972|nr:class I SAM-dependent methyltransferase [Synechococcus sp. Cruz-9H2]
MRHQSKLAIRLHAILDRLLTRAGLSSVDHSAELPPDCFDTPHLKCWFDDLTFQQCYQSSITAAGSDYRIPWRVHQLLWCLNATEHLDGDLVELGTGKGFMMAAAASYFQQTGDPRLIHLFDLFRKPDFSGEGLLDLSKYYASTPNDVMQAFSRYSNVCFHVGDVRQTLPSGAPDKISFLHVDLNNWRLEIDCMRFLMPRMQQGSVILLDDFANRGFDEAFDQHTMFFRDLGLSILTTPAGQGIVAPLRDTNCLKNLSSAAFE